MSAIGNIRFRKAGQLEAFVSGLLHYNQDRNSYQMKGENNGTDKNTTISL